MIVKVGESSTNYEYLILTICFVLCGNQNLCCAFTIERVNIKIYKVNILTLEGQSTKLMEANIIV